MHIDSFFVFECANVAAMQTLNDSFQEWIGVL